eukprot:CAMPEP_0198732180 /NCGR_PEP_ID=MMETSP1475-20131203/34256_1 /TAXON_ID= ORGANISM="Unidentified sp., Strain CCMP1999" /NCGR_SAMPLE_ID=MMETSP1475 /ASSEMBLY_ACC=CAM_ASM_001111 /LENGTH=769 /DNA_ID=CAMNT_0044495245 /DNA_START=147 /DNA_END=2456 /DNA_ORIENTATION=-
MGAWLILVLVAETALLARGAWGLEWINDGKYTNADEQLAEVYTLRSGLDLGTQEAFFGIEFSDDDVVSSGNTWIGLGVSDPDVGSMLGADVMTVEIGGSDDRDGLDCQVFDRYVPWSAYPLTEAPGPFPVEDDCEQSDWQLLSCQRDTEAGVVRLEVSRPLSARDDQDRPIAEGGNQMIWAYGSTFQYHQQNRGSRRLQLFPGSEPPKFPPSDADDSAELLFENFTVPAEMTTYVCQGFEVPVDTPRHIVAFEPIIQEATTKYVHHFILSQCQSDTDLIEKFSKPEVCGIDGATEDISSCSSVVYGWAKGGPPLILPAEAGFRVDATSNKFVLQIHYDNADLDEGVVDSSGVRIHTSSALREHDAGILNVGDVLVMEESPIEDGRQYQFSCPSQCTERMEHEITVFEAALHMHNLGRTAWTNHYDKDQNFKGTLSKRDFWDGGFQLQSAVDNVIVKPGDSLEVSCIYDLSKVETANFGPATSDEMCMDFLVYYPKVKLSTGKEFPVCGLYRQGQVRISLCGFEPEFVDNPSFADNNMPPNTFGAGQACPVSADSEDSQESSEGEEEEGSPAEGAPSPSTDETSSEEDEPACFAGSSEVELEDGSREIMANLQVGDRIRTGDTTFSDIYAFSHAREGQFKFINITTEAGQSLLVSPGHLVLVDRQLKAAGLISAGDMLSGGRVVSVERALASGLYNPHTLDGYLVVNGIRVTAYTTAVPPKLARILLMPVVAAYKLLGVNILSTLLHEDRYRLIRPLVLVWNSLHGKFWF